jgi:ankyrin repeat protein
LHWAARKGYVHAALLLLGNDAVPNLADKGG